MSAKSAFEIIQFVHIVQISRMYLQHSKLFKSMSGSVNVRFSQCQVQLMSGSVNVRFRQCQFQSMSGLENVKDKGCMQNY